MKRLAIAMAAACLSCVAHAPFRPATTSTHDASDAQLYKAAVRTLASYGAVQTNDASAGVVVTEWDEQGTIGNDKQRLRWRVTIGDNLITVNSDCEFWTDTPALTGGQKWTRCGDSQGDDRQAAAHQIAAEIAAAAQTMANQQPAPVQPAAAPAPQPAAQPQPTADADKGAGPPDVE